MAGIDDITLDTAAPTTGSITHTDGYYTTASVALTAADGTDATSGVNTSSRIVKRRSATLSAGTCDTYGSFANITPTGTYPNLTDSTVASGNCYQYQYLVSDNAGNPATYTGTSTAKVDTGAPTTTGAITGGTLGSNGWYTTNVTYTLTPADATSGVASTVYCTDTAGSCTPTTAYTTALTISTESATNHVRWKSTDNAGNVQGVQDSGVIKIDKTAPTGSFMINNLLSNSNFETDLSGFQEYNISAPSFTRVTSEYWYGAASAKAVADGSVGSQGFWISSSIIVNSSQPYTFSAYVKGSGQARVGLQERDNNDSYIQNDNSSNYTLTSSWQRISVSATLTASTSKARIYILTPSGTGTTATIYADTLQLEQKAAASPYMAWTDNQNVNLYATGSDAGSGLVNVGYSNDGTNYTWNDSWSTFKQNWAISSGNGSKTVWIKIKDAAGNETILTSQNIVLDTVAPSTGSISYTDGYYTSTSIALTASDGTDATSGVNTSSRTVQRKSATLSAGSCGSYGSFSTITPAGTYPNFTDSTVSSGNCYQYQYLVSDNAGNPATYTGTNTAKIDTGAPVTTLSSSPTSANGTNGYFKTNPTITLTEADTVSGVGPTQYKWDDVTFTSPVSYTGVIDMNATAGQGIHTLYYRSTDAAGNQETVKSQLFKLDSVAPSASSITSISPNPNNTGNQTVGWSAFSDPIISSGFGSYKLQRKQGADGSYVDVVTITDVNALSSPDNAALAEGTYYYRIVSTDAAGNSTNGPDSASLVVDVSPPSDISAISGYQDSGKANGLTSGNWYPFTVPYFEWPAATDIGSGVTGYKYCFSTDAACLPNTDLGNTMNYNPNLVSTPEGQYTLKVVAYDNVGYTSTTPKTFSYKYDKSVPGQVTGLNASNSNDTVVNLQWDVYSDSGAPLDKYKLERVRYSVYSGNGWNRNSDWSQGNQSQSEYASFEINAGTTTYTDTGVERSVKYVYRISAKDISNSNYGPYQASDIFGLTLDTESPTDPSAVTATSTASGLNKGYEVKLAWSPSSDSGVGIAKYFIWRRALANDIRAVNDSGLDASDPAQNVWTLVGVLDASGPVLAEWYDNDANNLATNADKIEASPLLNDYVDYFYRIVAIDASGNRTKIITTDPNTNLATETNYAFAKTVDATPPSIPSANATAMGLDDLNNNPATQKIDVTWTASSDETGRDPNFNGSGVKEYNLYRSQGDNSHFGADPVATISHPTTIFSDKGLEEFTLYYYKILAIDNSGNASGYSTIIFVRTGASAVPSSPTDVSVTTLKTNPKTNSNVGKQATIIFKGSFAKYYQIDKYEIYHSTTNLAADSDWLDPAKATKVTTLDIANIQDDRGNTHSYTDNGLSDAITYYYKVRAWDTTPQHPDNGPLPSGLSTVNVGTQNAGWDITPDVTAPATPQDVKIQAIWGANPGDIRMVTTWKKVDTPLRIGTNDFKEYQLFKSTDDILYSQVLVNGQNPLFNSNKTLAMQNNYYVDSDVKSDGTHYYYKVVAVDDAGEAFKYPSPPYNPNTIINNFNNISADSAKVDLNPKMVVPEILSLDNGKKTKVMARGVSSATIYWETNQPTESVVAYRRSGSNDQFITAGTEGMTTAHSVTIKALEAGTSYEYRVSGKNSVGNDRKVGTGTDDTNIVALQTLAFAIEGTKVETTTTTATINWYTTVESDSSVEYKLQKNPGEQEESSQTAGDPALLKDHQVIIKALNPGRTYTYKVRSVTADKYVADTQFLVFQTKTFDSGQFTIAPNATKIAEQNITATSARIAWDTAIATTSWVDFGTESSKYTMSAGDNNLNTHHVVDLKNLTPGQTYYYRVKGKDSSDIEYTSQEYSFTAILRPEIPDIKIKGIGYYSATIVWETNVNTESLIAYGKDEALNQRKGSSEISKQHEFMLDGLDDNTRYYFQIVARDKVGNEAKSQVFQFSTPFDNNGPQINQVKVDQLPMGESDETASIIISWTTNKPATTQVEYDEGVIGNIYSKTTVPDNSLSSSHTVIIKELNPSTTYRFRLVSKDKRGNMTKSQNYNFVTPTKEKSILQLILRSLEETFSWVKNVGGLFERMKDRVLGK